MNAGRLICLLIALGLITGSAGSVRPPVSAASPASISATADSVPEFAWRPSLPIDSMSSAISPIGGTETRALVGMDGKLYAAIGYWRDTDRDSPRLPGAQVLVLDDPVSPWRIDLELDDRMPSGPSAGLRTYLAIATLSSVTFHQDRGGHQLAGPVSMLVAGVWSRAGGLDVFSRSEDSSQWTRSRLANADGAPPGTQVRSFTVYADAVTHQEKIFAGATNAIYTGELDPSVPGQIHWDAIPETWTADAQRPSDLNRVMSFAACNGRLYATVYGSLYERQDGDIPAWQAVFTARVQARGPDVSGFRGATCVPNPSGTGDALLLGLEDSPSIVYRVNLHDFSAVQELNVSRFLSAAWHTRVTYAIVAYNNMVRYPNAAAPACPSLLLGLEAVTPDLPGGFGPTKFNRDASFLVRSCRGTYTVRTIRDPSVHPSPTLVSTRTLLLSPFAQDPEGTVFAGGFDANNVPVHNTAWLYKETPLR